MANNNGRWRELVCACIVGFAFAANYTNHAPMVGVLAAEFHFSLAMAGLLTTGIFVTHAAMQVPGGHLADRLGARRVVLAGLAVVAAGNLGMAGAGAYWHLLAWKIVTGVGTGVSIVAGARYIAEVYAGERAHLAQGFYGGSILLGSGFVILVVPRLLMQVGWRGSFLATTGLAVAAWLIWLAAAPAHQKAGGHAAVRLSELALDRRLWLLGVAQMSSFGLQIVVGTWITLYLKLEVGLGAAQAGLVGSSVLLLGMILRPLGGALVRVTGARRLLVGSLLASAAGCFMLARQGGSLGWAAAAILLVGIGCGLPYAAIFTGAAAMHPSRAGAAMGLVNMIGIVMILVAPPAIGYLVDWSGSFHSSFLTLGSFALLAAGLSLRVEQR
ncbi:MAG: MFS transporter [Candidatus Solibacter usitatus]|nr:MFS transporter [Candidatus Solibacter usitatus]